MTPDDFESFAKAWGAAAQMQTGQKLSDPAIKLAFRVLSDLTLEEVKHGLLSHCRSVKWIPTPSEILACVHGQLPSNTALYGLAVDGDTLMGRYIRSLMKGDIARLTQRDGFQRVEMLRSRIETFWQRALVGDYDERELRMFVASGMDPSRELAPGISGPRLGYRQAVIDRCDAIEPEAQIEHTEPEMSDEQRAAGRAALAEALATLKTGAISA